MFFSIVIPTYNRSAILMETLASVFSQSFSDYEVIIVDDGSTDNTREVIKALKNEKIKYFYKTNEERSIARNFGADQSCGEYLIFLDSDDKMNPGHLKAIYDFINTHPDKPSFIFSGYVILNPDKTMLYEFGLDGVFPRKKLFYGNYPGCSAVTVKSGLFKKYYFNTERKLILFEDWELWLRIISEHSLYCIPMNSIVMINHEGRSVLNYDFKEIESRIKTFKQIVLETCEAVKQSTKNRKIFLTGIYSYASLHIALTKKFRKQALRYLIMALKISPGFIFKKRFFGILKQLF